MIGSEWFWMVPGEMMSPVEHQEAVVGQAHVRWPLGQGDSPGIAAPRSLEALEVYPPWESTMAMDTSTISWSGWWWLVAMNLAFSQYPIYGYQYMVPSILFSQKYWVANHPNWRTHIFQRGGEKPPTSDDVSIEHLYFQLQSLFVKGYSLGLACSLAWRYL